MGHSIPRKHFFLFMFNSHIFLCLFVFVQRIILDFIYRQVLASVCTFRPLAPLFSLNWFNVSITITIIQCLPHPVLSENEERTPLILSPLPASHSHLSLSTWDPAPQAQPYVVMETAPHASVGLNDMAEVGAAWIYNVYVDIEACFSVWMNI